MCLLTVDSQKEEKDEDLMPGVFWKVFEISGFEDDEGAIKEESCALTFPVFKLTFKIDRDEILHSNRSSSPLTSFEKDCGEIMRGLHVFHSKRDAQLYVEIELTKRHASTYKKTCFTPDLFFLRQEKAVSRLFTVPVEGTNKDLIGECKTSLVFMKIKVDRETLIDGTWNMINDWRFKGERPSIVAEQIVAARYE